MRRIDDDKKKNYVAFSSLLVVLCVALLSIGWSAFQSTFNISGLAATIRLDRDIRVTGVYATGNTNSGRSEYEEYNVNSMYASAYLPYADSTVTYKIEVYNIGNTMEGIYAIEEIYKRANSNIDSNLEIKTNTVTLKERLCDTERSNICQGGALTKIYIKIGYKSNGYDGVNLTHNITLNFDFRRVFEITYNGFSNLGNLADQYKYMIDGDTKVIPLSAIGSPSAAQVVGATGQIANSNLTISNITVTGLNDTVVVNRAYTITYSGFTGSTSGMPSTMIYTGGDIEVPSAAGYPNSITVTGASGTYNTTTHVIPISNITGNITITASYGSSGSGTLADPYIVTSNTYDANDVDEGGVTKFSNAPGAPQVTAVEDSQGNISITSFEYTNASSTNPVVFSSGNSVETGVLALDGGAFTVHIKFKANLASNNSKFILAALEHNTSDDTYSGFSLFDYNSGYLRLGIYRNRARSSNTGLLTPNNYQTYNNSALSGDHVFDVTITYNPKGNKNKYGLITFTASVDSGTSTTKTLKNTKDAGNSNNIIPETLTNAVITIGGNGINNDDNINNMEVYEFSVTRN